MNFSFLNSIDAVAVYTHILSMVQTNDPEPVWDKPVDVPEKWIQTVDDNVYESKSLRRRASNDTESDDNRITVRLAGQGNISLWS